jgi:secreted trypsin-like serine protease
MGVSMDGFRSGPRLALAAAAGFCAALFASSPPAIAADQQSAIPGLQGRSAPLRATVGRYLGQSLGQAKIIGGEDAKLADHPWQVALLVSWIADTAKAQFCGGSIMSGEWVLTAAHCVNGNTPFDVHVLSGTANLEAGGRRFNVERIFVHKNYDAPSHDNDVALLKVKGSVTDGAPVKIATPGAEVDLAAPGKKVMVTGWGVTESGAPSVKLKQVSVGVISKADCNDEVSYSNAITDNMICAGYVEGGRDSCQGDSGGPLTAKDAAGQSTQVGVVSWGEGCADPGKYGVYARISKYNDWVAKCMATPDACEAKP